MPMTELQRDELREIIRCKPAHVIFATACGPLLYGFPHQNRYVDVRGVHLADPEHLPCRGGLQETREWRESGTEYQMEWVSHEVGKFVRLLQLNNGSAYEQLFSPHVLAETPTLHELRELAVQMLSMQLFQHYRSYFHSQLKFFLSQRERHSRHLLYLFRVALSGVHLLETGELLADLPQLARYHERASVLQLLREVEAHQEVRDFRPFVRELEALGLRLDAAPNRARLPELVPHRQAADEWLTRLRESVRPAGSLSA